MAALLAVRERLDVRCLVTFAPDPPRPFRAHPVASMVAQAEALGIEHRLHPVSAPLEASYERVIDGLAAEGIEVLVTGDIDRVEGHDSWIEARARDVVQVERPLWNAPRGRVLESLLEEGVQVLCTFSRDDAFPAPLAGNLLDAERVAELLARHGIDGFDACGENGEYHTSVLGGPGFRHDLRWREPRLVAGPGYHFLDCAAVERAPRAGSSTV